MNRLPSTILRAFLVTLWTVASAVTSRMLVAQASITVGVENTLAIARNDETVSLAWTALQAKLPGLDAKSVRVRDAGSGREIASQVLDSDGNGTPDALLFQGSFGAKVAGADGSMMKRRTSFAPKLP